MVDLGIGEAIRIREGDEGPYLVLWSADTLHGPEDSGRYFRVAIEQSPNGWRASVPTRPEWSAEASNRDDVKEKLAAVIADTLRHEEELIARHIESDPRRPGEGNARLKDAGLSVWAIVGHLEGVHGNIQQAADDYDVSREAVEAAWAHYSRHRAVIEARRAANRVPHGAE